MKWISKVTTALFTKVDSMLTNCQLLICIRKIRMVFLVRRQRQVNDLVWTHIYFQHTINNVIHRVTNLNGIVHRRLFRISSRFCLEKNHSLEINNYAHWNSYTFFSLFPFQTFCFLSHLYAIVLSCFAPKIFSMYMKQNKNKAFFIKTITEKWSTVKQSLFKFDKSTSTHSLAAIKIKQSKRKEKKNNDHSSILAHMHESINDRRSLKSIFDLQ